MNPFHSLSFNIEGVPGQIVPGAPLWGYSLAGRSGEFSGMTDAREEDWTIGDYFQAAAAFVSMPDVLTGLKKTAGLEDFSFDMWNVTLKLQKHGAFYHPIKMVISLPGNTGEEMTGEESFVLNGAVSHHGRELAQKEGTLLAWLENRLPDPVTPGVVASGEVIEQKGPAGFLMARWLEGYYEFHITPGENPQVAVWRPGDDTLYLSMTDALPAYENIARILTLAYEWRSGAQVLLWHHAAGDFILAPDLPGLPVKLITVRACGAMIDEDLLAKGPMPGLLFFFVNLCLRMQLDRFDGVGDPVFLGSGVLYATLRGFLKGLAQRTGEKGEQIVREVWEFLRNFPAKDLELILDQVIDVWPPGPSEQDLIASKKSFFARQMREMFKSGRFSDFY